MAAQGSKTIGRVLSLNALGTWVFSVAGALLAIPVGIKRKSLAPLVFFGTTGTMLDIIMGISACEREHETLTNEAFGRSTKICSC
ncbi:hypothetical protein HAX54_047104 [Datura stramonium]|uniref:Uncharacterized protein n=1 Tax=Datura stramonium TaxID=4076 RepID=A0ABS8SSN1_DATST|nr:hypothetical protein [Datura stramonium]